MEAKSIMHDLISENPLATKLDIIPEGTGEFGIEKSNPIPIYGIDNIENYFSKLRYIDESGKWLPVTYQRTNENDQSKLGTIKPNVEGLSYSTSAENIGENIDVYNIYTFDGKLKLAMLFIHCYHWKTSNSAPRGFKIIDNNENIVSESLESSISTDFEPLISGNTGWIIVGFIISLLGGFGGLLFGFNYIKKKYDSSTRTIGAIMIVISIIMMAIWRSR
jgi:hypothetical protein